MISLPKRKSPAHPPPLIRVNCSTIVFLTLCVQGRRPLLANSNAHALLIAAWKAADHWLVGRYVVMPDHVHLFCAPTGPDHRLRDWVLYWRYLVTRGWSDSSQKPIWQSEYWDTQLRRGENYDAKWDYVRMNPVRAGLLENPEAWPYAGEMNVLRW